MIAVGPQRDVARDDGARFVVLVETVHLLRGLEVADDLVVDVLDSFRQHRPDNAGHGLAHHVGLADAGAFGGLGIGEGVTALVSYREDGIRLPVADDAQELGEILQPFVADALALQRLRRSDRRAVPPDRDNGDGDADDDENERRQQRRLAPVAFGERFGNGDLADEKPGRAGDLAPGHQHLVARVVPTAFEPAGGRHDIGRRQFRRIQRQTFFERLGAVAQRREILDRVARPAHEIAFRRPGGFAGLDQSVEQVAVHRAHADDEADAVVDPRIALNAVNRHDEPDAGRSAGTLEHIDKHLFAGRSAVEGALEPGCQRRHGIGRRLDIAVPVDQRDTGLSGALDIRVHRRLQARRDETVARGRDIQKIPEISRGGQCFLGRGRSGIQRYLRHVELQRRILRQAQHGAELIVEPPVHVCGSAVGDDAETYLPLLQVAFALTIDERDNQKDTECHNGEQCRARRADNDSGSPSGFAFFFVVLAHRFFPERSTRAVAAPGGLLPETIIAKPRPGNAGGRPLALPVQPPVRFID